MFSDRQTFNFIKYAIERLFDKKYSKALLNPSIHLNHWGEGGGVFKIQWGNIRANI